MKKSILLFLAIVVIFIPAPCMADSPFFPSQLTNEGRMLKPDQIVDSESDIQSEIVKFKYQDREREVDAIVLYPKGCGQGRLPGILFLHTEDEIPAGQLKKMDEIAKCGYLIMTSRWMDKKGAEEAFGQFLKLNRLDKGFIGVMGAHEGGTEALRLACDQNNGIKAVESVTGRPPYDVPGCEPANYITAPVFLVHGSADTQLPCSVSQYFYETLDIMGKKPKIFFVPNSRHYFTEADWCQIMSESVVFFDQYLKIK